VSGGAGGVDAIASGGIDGIDGTGGGGGIEGNGATDVTGGADPGRPGGSHPHAAAIVSACTAASIEGAVPTGCSSGTRGVTGISEIGGKSSVCTGPAPATGGVAGATDETDGTEDTGADTTGSGSAGPNVVWWPAGVDITAVFSDGLDGRLGSSRSGRMWTPLVASTPHGAVSSPVSLLSSIVLQRRTVQETRHGGRIAHREVAAFFQDNAPEASCTSSAARVQRSAREALPRATRRRGSDAWIPSRPRTPSRKPTLLENSDKRGRSPGGIMCAGGRSPPCLTRARFFFGVATP
jgi:hypothetical protein